MALHTLELYHTCLRECNVESSGTLLFGEHSTELNYWMIMMNHVDEDKGNILRMTRIRRRKTLVMMREAQWNAA